MVVLQHHEQRFLLSLARQAIHQYCLAGSTLTVEEALANFGRGHRLSSQFRTTLHTNTGVFVTLLKKGQLRGCIGYIEPLLSLGEAIIENAINAAFHDPRFAPVSQDELSVITIELSLLSVPQPLSYQSPKELLSKLDTTMGLIVRRGNRRATFLPQVWEQLPTKEAFLSHLCIKAGLVADAWMNEPLQFSFYTVIHFSE
ncbi:MAG: AmmeMemoRadiSam system protein A [Candidatus Woesearchaeota archaeon]